MGLTESEFRQIQILLKLPTNELFPNSRLRNCIAQIVQKDLQYNLTIIQSIKDTLVAIADLDTKINDIKLSGSDGLLRERIYDDYDVAYRADKEPSTGFKELRSNLINQLYLDLGIKRTLHSGRKLRS